MTPVLNFCYKNFLSWTVTTFQVYVLGMFVVLVLRDWERKPGWYSSKKMAIIWRLKFLSL